MANWTGELPEKCDNCQQSLKNKSFVDGRIRIFPYCWMLLCLACHKQIGSGLGTGNAQMFDKDGIKVNQPGRPRPGSSLKAN